MSRSGRGERTRAAILDSAVRRFAVGGFQGTAVSDVAREVELSSAAVYAYFANKRALFTEAVDHDASRLIERSFAEIGRGDFDFDWAQILLRLLSTLPEHPLARRVLAGEEGKSVDRLLDLPAVVDVRNRFATELRHGMARGVVRHDIDPEQIAAGVEGLIMSLLIAVVQVGGAPDPVRATGLLALLDAAISPPPRPLSAAPTGGT